MFIIIIYNFHNGPILHRQNGHGYTNVLVDFIR